MFEMAAPVTDFTSFTAQLNLQFGPGSDEVVTGHIGRNLTRAGAWGEEAFAKTGAHTPAEIGTVMAHMTKLADKMDWSTAVFTFKLKLVHLHRYSSAFPHTRTRTAFPSVM